MNAFVGVLTLCSDGEYCETHAYRGKDSKIGFAHSDHDDLKPLLSRSRINPARRYTSVAVSQSYHVDAEPPKLVWVWVLLVLHVLSFFQSVSILFIHAHGGKKRAASGKGRNG